VDNLSRLGPSLDYFPRVFIRFRNGDRQCQALTAFEKSDYRNAFRNLILLDCNIREFAWLLWFLVVSQSKWLALMDRHINILGDFVL
jgi:hypothetical protein